MVLPNLWKNSDSTCIQAAHIFSRHRHMPVSRKPATRMHASRILATWKHGVHMHAACMRDISTHSAHMLVWCTHAHGKHACHMYACWPVWTNVNCMQTMRMAPNACTLQTCHEHAHCMQKHSILTGNPEALDSNPAGDPFQKTENF